ncbi:hypothetical protein Scep_014667 [Stephania cephalantha]|uniref:Uncharacterized protein n=1 Tax=Stephania cephalantha TaxID=152367 RepID=A0AAP0J497_9MAGN
MEERTTTLLSPLIFVHLTSLPCTSTATLNKGKKDGHGEGDLFLVCWFEYYLSIWFLRCFM